MSDPDITDPEGERIESIDHLAARVDAQESKLDKILSLLGAGSPAHKAAEQHTERHLDRPSSVEEQVRAELEKAERERKAAADKEAEKSERESMRETLAKLVEKAPEPPQPRRERLMWGKRS